MRNGCQVICELVSGGLRRVALAAIGGVNLGNAIAQDERRCDGNCC
jgi:hypothetical protein